MYQHHPASPSLQVDLPDQQVSRTEGEELPGPEKWKMLEDVGSFSSFMLKSNMSNYLGLCVWFGNVWDDGFTWIQIQMSFPRQRWEAFFGDRCCTILKLHAPMSPQRNRPQDETTSFRHYSESLA